MMKKPNHIKPVFKWVFTLMIIISTSTVAVAQDDPPFFPPDVDDEVPAAPIDGFVGLVLAAGACLGIKKANKKKV